MRGNDLPFLLCERAHTRVKRKSSFAGALSYVPDTCIRTDTTAIWPKNFTRCSDGSNPVAFSTAIISLTHRIQGCAVIEDASQERLPIV